MKVSTLIPLLLSPLALAVPRHTLRQRQATLKRGLVDVCVGLDLDVTLLDILPDHKPLVAGHLDLCLCLSVLPDFCKSNPVARNVANLLGGEDQAHDFFANLIHSQPGNQQCHYPEHCEPICDISKPCHFGCKDGFVPDNRDHPTQCICPAPNTVCNGHCGSFPHGCASPVPTPPGGNPPHHPPTPPGHGPTCPADLVDLLLNLNLIAKVADIVDLRARLAAALQIGTDCDDLLQLWLDLGLIVDVAGLVDLKVKLGLGVAVNLKREDSSRDANNILNGLIAHNLLARDADHDWILKGLIVALDLDGLFGKPCEDFLSLLIELAVVVVVEDVAALEAELGLWAHVLRRDEIHPTADDLLNLILVQGLVADVAHLVLIKDVLGAWVHIGPLSDGECDDLLNDLLGRGLLINVLGLVDLKVKLGLVVSVL